MKTHLLKPLLASLLLVGCISAQAAHFEVLSYSASSKYTGTVDYDDFNYLGSYTSGGGDYGTAVTGYASTSEYEHAGSASGAFIGGSLVDMSTSVSFNSLNPIEYYGLATAVEKTIQLKVVADSGDLGPVVNVSFAGMTSTFNSLSGSEGTFQTNIRVTKNGSVLGNFSTQQFADQNINFAFTVQTGDTLILSASQGVHMNATGPINASLTGFMNGAFTVTAVPEPESYAMLLAGLGLLGVAARRRRNS
jgi:hypothetical protein